MRVRNIIIIIIIIKRDLL